MVLKLPASNKEWPHFVDKSNKYVYSDRCMGDACVIGKLEDDLGDFKALSVRVIQF